MNYRFLKLTLATLLSLGLLASCASFSSTVETEVVTETEMVEETNDSDTSFVLGFDANFPPYGFKNVETSEFEGFDIDLARELCERNQWNLELMPIDWDSKDMELSSGTIDVIWNGFTITGREDKYTWTKPYVDNSQVFVVKADSDIQKLTDLKGKNVTVQADSSALAAINDEKNAELKNSLSNLEQVPDYNVAFLNLAASVTDAVALDVGVANFQIQSRDASAFRILPDPLSKEQYAIGFKLGNTELRDKVQKTLDEMGADGTFMKIAKKWGLESSVIPPKN